MKYSKTNTNPVAQALIARADGVLGASKKFYTQTNNFVWANDDLTPQEALDALVSESADSVTAADLITAHGALGAYLDQLDPGFTTPHTALHGTIDVDTATGSVTLSA